MASRAHELRELMQQMFRRFGALANDATPCGKPVAMAHAHALMQLLASDGLTQQALGQQLGIDKSNVARLCARMVEAGHVTQIANAEDGRSRMVTLTSRGARLAREIEAASLARFTAVLEQLAVPKQKQTIEALGLLLAAIEALPTTTSLDE